MPPKQFAQEVVREIGDGKQSFLWKSTNAFSVWLLNAFGPRTVLNSLMVTAAGLGNKKTRVSVYERGQEIARKAVPS